MEEIQVEDVYLWITRDIYILKTLLPCLYKIIPSNTVSGKESVDISVWDVLQLNRKRGKKNEYVRGKKQYVGEKT